MVTSVHDTIPRAGAADYDCSKGGQLNLTRTLASSDADYVTGATFYIDGGLMQNQGQGA